MADEIENPIRDSDTNETFLQWVSWIVLLVLILFAVTTVAGEKWQGARFGLLLTLLVLVALWFIACFTGDAGRNKRHAFVFAYAFTFGSFALLVTPFVAPPHAESAPGGKGAAAPAASGTQASNAAAAPASASDSRPIRPPEGVLQLVRGCVVSDMTGSDAVSAVTRCPAWVSSPPASSAASADFKEVGRQFAWLVSIGGVTVRKFEPLLENGEYKPLDSFVVVYGGIAVPLFVIVLAFIGGAVSLSRRIPEYQRRSEPGYASTAAEPAMQPFQARESVVFQIMQLVSAPFLAMATWYIVSPTTIAVAAGLAFGTGFASEPLLLMIRGMVEGIRPAGAAPKSPKEGVAVTGVVRDADKQPVADVDVGLQVDQTKEKRIVTTNAEGRFAFAAVQPGSVRLSVSTPTGKAEQMLMVTEQAPAPVELVLTAG
jgi:hypothetical protein